MPICQEKPLGIEFVIGGLAGIGTAIITNPADMLKTRLQLQGQLAAAGTYKKLYSSTLQAVRIIVQREGLLTLQAGLTPAIGLQIIVNGTRLGSYFLSKRLGWTVNDKGETIAWRTALLSGVVSSLAYIVGSPLYLAKVKLQNHCGHRNKFGYPRNLTTRSIFKSLWQKGGIQEVYSAWYGNVPRLFIGSAVQITVFGLTMDRLNKHETLENKKSLSAFIASIVAGTILVMATQPLDIMATRVYNQGSKLHETKLYNGIFDVIWKTVKIEGFSGLYKGTFPSWLRLVTYVVVSQELYQYISIVYEDLNE